MIRFGSDDMSADEDEDEFDGFSIDNTHSVFYSHVKQQLEEEETIATPIPQNEQTVILCDPNAAGVKDGELLALKFDGDNCAVYSGARKIGTLKSAYVQKLKTERGGQKANVYFKKTTPPMVRIVFCDDGEIVIES